MQQSTIHHSKGFALVTVMVMSFLGSLVVFGTMQENINQERMSGNDIKELNANLQAENGMAATYNIMKANSGLSQTELIALFPTVTTSSGGYQHIVSDRSATDSTLEAEDIGISSNGSHYEAEHTIRGAITIGALAGNNLFAGAITTCDGAQLNGAGYIDSYDSSNGSYDPTNRNTNGDLYIINSDAIGLDISNGADIYGNVYAHGDLDAADGRIHGDVHISGDIDYGTGHANNAGSTQATGNITTSNTINSTSLSANGFIKLRADYDANNINVSGTSPVTTIKNGVTINGEVDPYDTDQVGDVYSETCDILDLASEFANTLDGVGSLAGHAATSPSFGYPYSDPDLGGFRFSSSGLTAYDESYGMKQDVNIPVESQTINFLGTNTLVYILDINGFNNGSRIIIESGNDVTLYLSDSTSIQDDIIVQDGASLTIITDESFEITSGGTIQVMLDNDSDGVYETPSSSTVNGDGKPYVMLYSGYDSANNTDYGVTLRGGSDIQINAYAPSAAIVADNGGDLFGALRGDYLLVSGDGGIHFDENIGTAEIGPTIGSATGPVIKRWF